MSDLQSALEVLYQEESVAKTLILLDDYMGRSRKLGSQFQLPHRHVWMLPLIARYTKDLRGFWKFSKGVWQDFAASKDQREALYKFYKRIEGRWTQQWIRAREAQAYAWLALHYPGMRPVERKAWMDKLNKWWSTRRRAMLDKHRASTKRGRMSNEEQEYLLEQFWDAIDKEIERGELPPPEGYPTPRK